MSVPGQWLTYSHKITTCPLCKHSPGTDNWHSGTDDWHSATGTVYIVFTWYVIQVLHVLATDSTSLADPNLLTYHGGMLIPMAQPTTPAKATSHHLS